MSPREPFVSIFIPSYNDQIDLSACLGSLRRMQYPKEKLELVIWDNGSTDETIPMVEQYFKEMEGEGWLSLRLIRHTRNEGSYVPYNLVFSDLSPQTEYVLGLDADVELAPDVLSCLVEAANAERVGVVGARSVVFREPEQTAHGAGFVNRWTAKYSERDASEQIECDYVIGCCWLFDKRCFRDVGGFAVGFFINHWEVDYCLQAKTRGWKVLYEPRAVAKHKIQCPAICSPSRRYYMFRNKFLMIRQNGYFVNRFLTTALCACLSFGRIVSIAIAERSMGNAAWACRGLYDGLRGVTGVLSAGSK